MIRLIERVWNLYKSDGISGIIAGVRRFILWKIVSLRKKLTPYIRRHNHQIYEYKGRKFTIRYNENNFDYLFDVVDGKQITGIVRDETITTESIPLSVIDTNEPVDAIIDVGAHVGIYSVLLQQQNPDASLYAFEPNENNRKILQRTLSENNIEGVISDAVITDKSGTTTFYVDPEGVSQSNSTARTDEFTPIEKQTISLADFFDEKGINSAFVKIDAEGEELAIIRDLFNSNIEYLEGIVEVHPDKMSGLKEDLTEQLTTRCDSHKFLGNTAQNKGTSRPMYHFVFTTD